MSPATALMSLGVKVKSPFLLDTWTTWSASLPLSAGMAAILVALLSAEDMERAPLARRREVVVREVISCIIAESTCGRLYIIETYSKAHSAMDRQRKTLNE